jgi:hypothetical protein
VLRIKQLLYEEGFTIAGAKKRLESELQGRVDTPTPQPTPPGNGGGGDGAGREALKQIREGLREILTLLESNDRSRV